MKKLFVFIILSVVSMPGAIAQTLNAATPNSDIIYYRFIKAPSSNLHLDASLGNDLLLNHYNGNKIKFGPNGNWMTITNQGKVGIGIDNPLAKLHIDLTSSGKGLQILGSNLNVDFHLGHNGSTHGFYWRYKGVDTGNNNDLELWANNQAGSDLQVYNIHQNGTIQFLQKVSIGCEAQSDASFAVNGTIKATEIKVATGWSDFVFEPDYDLKSLDQVEDFITENGHLPNIPSAEDVEENGISLGEMDAKLLQKIEELTLYVIELKRENEQQTIRLSNLEEENVRLKKVIE